MTTKLDKLSQREAKLGEGQEQTVGVPENGMQDPSGQFPKVDYHYGPSLNKASVGTQVNKLATGGGDVGVAQDVVCGFDGCVVYIPNQNRLKLRRARPTLQGVAVIFSGQDDARLAIDGALHVGVADGRPRVFGSELDGLAAIPETPSELRGRTDIRRAVREFHGLWRTSAGHTAKWDLD